MLIQAATADDAARVCEMTAAVSDHEVMPPPKTDTETFLRFGFGPDRAFECYVAQLSDRLVGHASMTWGFDFQEGSRVVWLADLFVEPEHRGKGIGRTLMAEAVWKRSL